MSEFKPAALRMMGQIRRRSHPDPALFDLAQEVLLGSRYMLIIGIDLETSADMLRATLSR